MFTAALILLGVPTVLLLLNRSMEATETRTAPSLPPSPDAPVPGPTPCTMDLALYSATTQPVAPVFNVLNQAGKELLSGFTPYLTAAGQEAIMGALTKEILQGEFRASRATVVRHALTAVFPDCNWQTPLEDFTADQYQAWMSAWTISAAIEADAGLDLDQTPRTATPFIHRQDLGLLGLQNQVVPVGSLVLLEAADQSGDNAELVQATVSSLAVDAGLNQDVIIESAPAMSAKHGVKQGDKYVVSVPWNVLAILQTAQGNPRQPNPFGFMPRPQSVFIPFGR